MALPADLGLTDAEKLKIKTGLVIEISRAINRLKLTQHEAAKRMGIEIIVRPAKAKVGHLLFVIA